MSKVYTFTKVHVLSQEDLDDILDAALNFCSHWCDELSIKKLPEQETKYMSEMVTRGGTLQFKIDEPFEEGGKTTFVLTERRLVKGIQMTGYLDPFEIDGPMADEILQNALFGEVVYG